MRRARIRARRARPDPPVSFVGRPPPLVLPPATGVAMRGLPASGGVVEGRARVIGSCGSAAAPSSSCRRNSRGAHHRRRPFAALPRGGGESSPSSAVRSRTRRSSRANTACPRSSTCTAPPPQSARAISLRVDGDRGVVERLPSREVSLREAARIVVDACARGTALGDVSAGSVQTPRALREGRVFIGARRARARATRRSRRRGPCIQRPSPAREAPRILIGAGRSRGGLQARRHADHRRSPRRRGDFAVRSRPAARLRPSAAPTSRLDVGVSGVVLFALRSLPARAARAREAGRYVGTTSRWHAAPLRRRMACGRGPSAARAIRASDGVEAATPFPRKPLTTPSPPRAAQRCCSSCPKPGGRIRFASTPPTRRLPLWATRLTEARRRVVDRGAVTRIGPHRPSRRMGRGARRRGQALRVAAPIPDGSAPRSGPRRRRAVRVGRTRSSEPAKS